MAFTERDVAQGDLMAVRRGMGGAHKRSILTYWEEIPNRFAELLSQLDQKDSGQRIASLWKCPELDLAAPFAHLKSGNGGFFRGRGYANQSIPPFLRTTLFLPEATAAAMGELLRPSAKSFTTSASFQW
jgi:hypothetical protein